MLSVISITAPIFTLIALGFLAGKTRLISAESIRAMGGFVLYFTLPALIFRSLSSADYAAIIEPYYLLAYGLGSLTTLILGFSVYKVLLSSTFAGSGVAALGVSLPNSIFIGYPVLLQVFGEAPTAAFAMSVMIENLLIMPVALVLLELGAGDKHGKGVYIIWKKILQRIITNPILIAIALGLIVARLNLHLPAFLNSSLEILSRSTAAVALFVIGGSLVGTSFRGNHRDIMLIVSGKLIVHPLIVIALIWMLPGFDRHLQMAAIVIASMPMASIYPILVGRSGYQQTASSALLMATISSFFTIAIVLMLLNRLI